MARHTNTVFATKLDRRGPLHPAWLTSLRSLFAARSVPVALIGGVPCTPPGSLHSARLFAVDALTTP